MAMITGGHIIHGGNVMAETEVGITWTLATPTDANVGGGYRTPANGEIACNTTNGNIYERQAGVWVRIDTL